MNLKDNRERQNRYSLRKTTIGVGSVLIGMCLASVFGGVQEVSADNEGALSENASVVNTVVQPANETATVEEAPHADPVTGVRDHWTFESENNHQVASEAHNDKLANLSGGVTLSEEDEVFGKSLQYNGQNTNKVTVDNYVNMGEGMKSFAFWYYYDSQQTPNDRNSSVLLQQSGDGRTLLARKPDGKIFTYVNAREVSSKNTLANDQWQHVAVTFDQNTQKGKFYINGEFDSEVDLGSNKVNAVTNLLIGAHKRDNNNDPHPMRGKLDELYTFDKVLSNEEVRALYEDKAKPMTQVLLKKAVLAAQQIYESNTLSPEVKEAQNLKSAIDKATPLLTKAKDLNELKGSLAGIINAVRQYQAVQPVNITVNPETVERIVDADSIFGINHRYAFNGYGSFDSTNHKVKDDFKALYKKAGFGSIRYPGGTISNLFNWKTAIGDVANRKKQIHGFYNNPNQHGIAPNFGLAELGTFTKEMDSEIVYVYSLARGNKQDVADLMEYFNAEVGTNPNGGIDWAAVRASEGHKDPFNVRYFEIGNEMQLGGPDGTASQQYWTAFVPGKSAEQAYIEGGTAQFNKQYAVMEEDWNKASSVSDGSANMKRYMRYANVNPGKLGDNGKIVNDDTFVAVVPDSVEVYVGNDHQNEKWTQVNSFDHSQATDKHYRIDLSTGAIIFGDGQHGMIPTKGQQIYVSYRVHKDGFIDISKSLKETMAAIDKKENKKREANVYTSFESHGFIRRMNEKNANQYYDGMTIHPYSGHVNGGENPELFYDNAMKKAEDVGIKHVRDYVQMLPEGKVPVISEFGIFRNTESQLRSLTHALYIAKNIMEYVRLGSPYIQKHTLVDWYSSGADSLGPTQQAVIQAVARAGANTVTGEGKFEFFATPSAHVFEMLNQGFGDQVVSLNVGEHEKLANGVTPVSAIASKDKAGNLYLAVLNVDRTNSRLVNLKLDGALANRRVEVQTLTADSITSENSLENPNNVSVVRSELKGSDLASLRVGAHTFMVLKVVNEASTSTNENAPVVDLKPVTNVMNEVEKAFSLTLKALKEAENQMITPEVHQQLTQMVALIQQAKSGAQTAIEKLPVEVRTPFIERLNRLAMNQLNVPAINDENKNNILDTQDKANAETAVQGVEILYANKAPQLINVKEVTATTIDAVNKLNQQLSDAKKQAMKLIEHVVTASDRQALSERLAAVNLLPVPTLSNTGPSVSEPKMEWRVLDENLTTLDKPTYTGPISKKGTSVVNEDKPMYTGPVSKKGTSLVNEDKPMYTGLISKKGSSLTNEGKPLYQFKESGTLHNRELDSVNARDAVPATDSASTSSNQVFSSNHSNGDSVLATSQTVERMSADQLPETGEQTIPVLFSAAALAILSGVGLIKRREEI